MTKDKGEIKTPREKVNFKGTVRFASIACHKGQEMGKKDDIESWIYLIVDLMSKGGPPWRKLTDKHAVGDMKQAVGRVDSQVSVL